MKPSLALHRLPLYNTGRLDDEEIIAAFAARGALFDRIIADLAAEGPDSRAQHHLLVGQRGMGKTMLLSRIAAEIRTGLLSQRYVPLVFAEEQYAVDRLSKFWLNCLDSLADARERAGVSADAERIDNIVSSFSSRISIAAKDDMPLANDVLDAFLKASAEISRRPVLLVDNLQLVFERITEVQQHALRELLMRPGSPVLIGASPSPPPESQDYGAAFYDHFKVHYLRPLEVEEMQALMLHLADAIGREDVRSRIVSHPHRLQVLRQLTGGNPRTTATLFFLYAEDFAPTVFGDLENLLDRVTPLYKARFEELSAQQQVIASAIANHWDPVTSRILSEITGLPATGISGQLDRLEKTGFIERVTLFGQASTGYQIAERFFNVWFLMRSASRRQRREVEFLTRFLENFYETDDRSRIAKCLLDECNFSPDRHLFTKALAATLDDKAMAEDLERHAHLDALRQKAAEARRKLDEILDLSSLPPATLSFNELREKLMSLVPEGAGVTPEQFAEAILGDRQMFESRERERLASKSKNLSEEEVASVLNVIGGHVELDENSFGETASRYVRQRLATGQIRTLNDSEDWNRAIVRCDDERAVCMILDILPESLVGSLSPQARQKAEMSLGAVQLNEPEELRDVTFGILLKFGRFEECLKVSRARVNDLKQVKCLIERRSKECSETNAGVDDAIKHEKYISECDRGMLVPKIQSAIGIYLTLEGVVLCLLGRNEEARSALVEATAMCTDFADSWAFLGDVNSELGLIDESEKAYFQAAKFKTCSLQGLECLLSFYLDVHGDFSTSRQMIERARIQQDEVSVGYQSLHDSIFAAFDKDWGIAESAFCKALDWHVNDLSVVENSEWLRTSAWLIHLNYGEELLSLLEQRGDHLRFRPWYEALKAIQLGNRDYLLNIAPEIRTTAEALYDAIKERLDKLPESTRRRRLPKAAKKRGKRR